MADRRVVVHLTTKLIMNVEEGVSIDHIISDLDYDFSINGEETSIHDTEIKEYHAVDSK